MRKNHAQGTIHRNTKGIPKINTNELEQGKRLTKESEETVIGFVSSKQIGELKSAGRKIQEW